MSQRNWVMHQSWRDLLFAHWPLPPDVVAPLLPAGVELDTFDGVAWLAVVPFRMADIHPRGLPPLPPTDTFPELNVRTYVRAGGVPGVWFFSLDAASWPAVVAARVAFHLPYRHAVMTCRPHGDAIDYQSRRDDPAWPGADLVASYGPAGDVFQAAPGSLELWLTDRLSLFAVDRAGTIYRGTVNHGPWPLQPAWAEVALNTMAGPTGIDLMGPPPLVHFARRLDVHTWMPRRIRGGGA